MFKIVYHFSAGKKRKGKTSVDGDSGPTTSKRRDSGQEKIQSLAELQGLFPISQFQ